MHYDATNYLAFCLLCNMGAKSGKLSTVSSSGEIAFIFCGFSNWKIATRCLTSMQEA